MKKLPRREFLRLAGLAVASSALSRTALAQAYPARPVRLVVPFNAGGSTDLIGRIMCQWLSERLGQPFRRREQARRRHEHRNSARGQLRRPTATRCSTRSPPTPSIHRSTSHCPSTSSATSSRSAGSAELPLVLVMNPQVPAKDVAEFIAYAKANPGKVNMASFGVRTISHLSIELLKTSSRHRIRSHPVHRRRADGDRHHLRPDSGRRRRTAELAAAHPERLDARARDPVAGSGRPRFLTCRPWASSSRDSRLTTWNGVGAPTRHTPRDRRAAQPRDQRGPAGRGAAEALRRRRRRADPGDAGRDGRVDRQGHRQVGQGGKGRGPAAGMMRHPGL